MAKTLKLSVVAPDRTVVDEDVQSVICPGVTGYLGIWPGHEPSIIALKVGLVEYLDSSNQRHHIAIGGGFLETSGASAIVLADTAERASDIDLSRAEAALERARKALRGESSETTSDDAVEALARAMNRVKLAKRAG